MPKIYVQHETPLQRSFRVDQVCGVFDVPLSERHQLDLSVHVPPLQGPGSDWQIGAIIGPSASGKSSVASQAYGERFIEALDWPEQASILDGFPRNLPNKLITATLAAVGFSSPPQWVLPYRCLSTGQKFRANLARALLLDPADGAPVAVDEFGGTVTQQVAEFAAASVARAVRNKRTRVNRFVAVGARDEFVDWLEPDWVLDMSECRLARGWVRRERNARWAAQYFRGRPKIELDIHQVRGSSKLRLWSVFKHHHYLSAQLHPSCRMFIACYEGKPIALCATLTNAGFTGYRVIHRLVVMPDYQGLGIGLKLLDEVAGFDAATCRRVSIITSHPALIRSLEHRATWQLLSVTKHQAKAHAGAKRGKLGPTSRNLAGSAGRAVCSFMFVGHNCHGR